MKLKTKFQDEDFDLGEVVEGVIVECLGKHEEKIRVTATAAKGGQHTFYYSSIKKFMDDWEDAPEEPKGIKEIFFTGATVFIAMHNQKEAIEMEEKLKALERLKDKGFKFESWDYDGGNYQERIRTGRILFRVKDYEEVEGLLNMVFGDEE